MPLRMDVRVSVSLLHLSSDESQNLRSTRDSVRGGRAPNRICHNALNTSEKLLQPSHMFLALSISASYLRGQTV